MLRKAMFALVAIGTVASAALPTAASAYWRGGWHGGWRGPGWGYYGAPYVYGPGPYAGCYRDARVWTPYGWRWRRVWVCG